jgi:hypothetical protein
MIFFQQYTDSKYTTLRSESRLLSGLICECRAVQVTLLESRVCIISGDGSNTFYEFAKIVR